MIDLNPLNSSPLASFDTYYGLRNDILKMILPIYFVFFRNVDYELNSSQTFMLGT